MRNKKIFDCKVGKVSGSFFGTPVSDLEVEPNSPCNQNLQHHTKAVCSQQEGVPVYRS